MSDLRIGDRVQVVEWAPEIDHVPPTFRSWVDGEWRYSPAVGRLELIDDRLGRPAYWVRLERQRVTWTIETANGDIINPAPMSYRLAKEKVVIVRAIVSLEPIQIQAVRLDARRR